MPYRYMPPHQHTPVVNYALTELQPTPGHTPAVHLPPAGSVEAVRNMLTDGDSHRLAQVYRRQLMTSHHSTPVGTGTGMQRRYAARLYSHGLVAMDAVNWDTSVRVLLTPFGEEVLGDQRNAILESVWEGGHRP